MTSFYHQFHNDDEAAARQALEEIDKEAQRFRDLNSVEFIKKLCQKYVNVNPDMIPNWAQSFSNYLAQEACEKEHLRASLEQAAKRADEKSNHVRFLEEALRNLAIAWPEDYVPATPDAAKAMSNAFKTIVNLNVMKQCD